MDGRTWTEVGIEPKFLNGLRVTDADTMEIVEMVLVGKVNKSLVSLINVAGGRAVGICGKDGNTLRGRVRDEELGFVGDVTSAGFPSTPLPAPQIHSFPHVLKPSP